MPHKEEPPSQPLGSDIEGILDQCLIKVFDAAPNGFVLVDKTGKIVLANPRLQWMFGYALSELIDSPIEKLLPERYRTHHPRLRSDYANAPQTRSMGVGRDLFAQHADGHEFPVEIGLNPIETPAGNMTLASVVDITERKRMENAFRNVFEASPYGLLMVNQQGLIFMANRRIETIFGYATYELEGQPLSVLIPDRYREDHGEKMRSYRNKMETRMMGENRDLTGLHRDGSEVPVEIGLSPVQWKEQKMTLAAITDITARKKTELELRQANADLEEFSYVASHDLKSPLRGISDLLDWVNEDLADTANSEVKKNLDRIGVRIRRMEKMITDLLAYARAGKTDIALIEVDINDIIDKILEIQPLPANFKLHRDITVPPFKAAHTPLETVLRNLLSNAIKHHDQPSGQLHVTAHTNDSYCQIRISDDGPGIPPAAQERVFQLFQTLSGRDKENSGIGLAVTKRLVESHGGKIRIVASNQPRGTTFEIQWPRFARKDIND